MNRFRSTALCASVMMALTACGGGDADINTAAPATLTGLAATGAAIPNADVTARCVAGDPLAGKTDANGVFTLTLSATHTAPCMLEVVNGTSRLYSFATEAGRVNITPATDLVVAHALKGNPADVFAGFGKETASDIRSGLDAAKTYVKAQLKAVTGADYATDPIADALVVGDASDKVLDALAKALGDAGKSITDLREGARTGASLTTLLAKEPGTGEGGGGGATVPSCNTSLFSGGVRNATAQEIASFGTEYIGEAGTFNINGEFQKTGEASLALSTAGALTVNAKAQTVSSICMETAASQLVVHFGANGHVDLKAAGKFNGVLADGSTVIRSAQATQPPTEPPASTSFFGSNKTAANIAFLNGQSFTGTNCSVSFANGMMTVTDTANNRTASTSFSGDALDRIVPANGRAQIDFEFSDDMQVISGKTYPATGKPSASGKFQIADYVNAQATVLEATVTRHDGAGNVVGAACRNINKPLTSWVRPTLSSGSLNFLDSYSTDLMQTLSLATHVPKLVGSYTGSMGAYKKVQLKPTFSVLANLTSKTCTLNVDAQGKAVLSVEGGVPTSIDLVGRAVLFHGGIMLPVGTSATDTEYIKGYAFGSVAQTLMTWADGAAYQGPGAVNDYTVTAADGSYREEYTCVFK